MRSAASASVLPELDRSPLNGTSFEFDGCM